MLGCLEIICEVNLFFRVFCGKPLSVISFLNFCAFRGKQNVPIHYLHHVPFIDIHTHSHLRSAETFTIRNFFGKFSETHAKEFYSLGLHPWYLKSESAEAELEELKHFAEQKNILAIGECGLDKVCSTDWKLQLNYFRKQITLANQVKKPLIIHCVRAWEEVLDELKKMKAEVPVIFHGFNKSPELAQSVLKQNESYYLSFGKHLENENVANVFRQLPLEKVFLETDSSDLKIENIYEFAAKAVNESVEFISIQIERNFKKVFGQIEL